MTPKQEKLLELIIENYGKKGETKTLGELLKKAGYSKSSCDNPKRILEGDEIKDKLKDVTDLMAEKRKMALKAIDKEKLDKSAGRDLAYISDVMTKNHQLLTGGDTERIDQPVLVQFINEDDKDSK